MTSMATTARHVGPSRRVERHPERASGLVVGARQRRELLVRLRPLTEAQPELAERLLHEGDDRAHVRGGGVAAVVCNGEVVLLPEAACAALGPWPRALPARSFEDCDVLGLFDRMEASLRDDAAAGRRPFTMATFDDRDGHPTRYVRYWKPGGERLEWNVVLRR